MISIVVPVFKVEKYINVCVDSILAQTYKDFELILVDDGSPDKCGAICDEYALKDNRIKVIHQKNGGLSAARNAGIELIRGELVTFIDSDDLIHPECMEIMHKEMTKHNADVCICAAARFKDDIPLVSLSMTSNVITGREACLKQYGDNGVKYVTAWGKLYKSSLFSEIRYPIRKLHEDEATTYKVLYNSTKVCDIEDSLYFYRLNNEGIMHSAFNVRRYDGVKALEERARFYREVGDYELERKTIDEGKCLIAKLSLQARMAGKYKEIPEEYRISKLAALKLIKNNVSSNLYEWYLLNTYDRIKLPYEYSKKVKRMISGRN